MKAADERIYHLLQLVAHRLRTHADRASLATADITAAQAGALFVIARKPGATQRIIAQSLGQQESAITAMVARLVDSSLVERTPSTTDARAWSLRLTNKGQDALQTVRIVLDDMNRRIEASIGAGGIEELATALRALLAVPLD